MALVCVANDRCTGANDAKILVHSVIFTSRLRAQTIRGFQELNYWGKESDHMHAYPVGGNTTYIDPNTTPLWAPTIPVSKNSLANNFL